MASLVGQWDFDLPEVTSLAEQLVSAQVFRSQAQAGLLVHRRSGLAMRIVTTYDGIGDNSLHAYGGQFWLSLPFN